MEGNAYEVFSFLSDRGWTTNAIAGILGNMQSESNINPGVWQNLDSGNYSLGFGLVQWTPATNYTNWASANGYNITDPEDSSAGLMRLLYPLDSGYLPAGIISASTHSSTVQNHRNIWPALF